MSRWLVCAVRFSYVLAKLSICKQVLKIKCLFIYSDSYSESFQLAWDEPLNPAHVLVLNAQKWM